MDNTSHHHLEVRDARALQARWSTIFTASFLAKLRLDITHEMFVHDGTVMLGDGELWFDDKGLVAVNPVVDRSRSR
jgi:hypothetical protein